MATEQTLWGIHAGRTGDADSLFTKQNVIALGWARLDDLSKLPPTREAFKKYYAEGYPEASGGTIPTSAGQLFRFVNEMKAGDLVAYPSKSERFTSEESRATTSSKRVIHPDILIVVPYSG
jgi:restriction system protein